jgi:hypothetical protein
LLSSFGEQLRHSRARNPEPLCDLLVRESDCCQFGGTFTALLTKSLLLFSRFSDSHGSPVLPPRYSRCGRWLKLRCACVPAVFDISSMVKR